VNKNRNPLTFISAFFVLLATVPVHGQTYSDLYNLGSNSGDPTVPQPPGLFAQGRDGNLYSTSQRGGANDEGTVFQLTPNGTMKVLHSFVQVTGHLPVSGLTLGADGNLYGTTVSGGTLNNGVVFKISTGGTYTVLHNLDVNKGEGSDSEAPPVQGNDGNFYGTAKQTGIGFGAIYKMTPSGAFTTIHFFADNSGGSGPGALTLGTDGNFYGVAETGGANDAGTIFKVTPQGGFTLLHSFDDTGGRFPIGAMIQASDGNFYGTAWQGGAFGGGVVYKISSTGVFSDIYDFGSALEFGLFPFAGLEQANNGKLYGVASTWGSGAGTLFQITTGGQLIVLHDFDFTNGGSPAVALIQHTNGSFYSDAGGGPAGDGVLYRFKNGLKAFTSLVPNSGKVGSVVGLLGQGFNGTTSVSFNGTPAAFSVKSNTFLTATVPSGATSGFVTVVTSNAVLTSNRKFRLRP
jgi:uncharacterized repeat protein (TIGR03803 family)